MHRASAVAKRSNAAHLPCLSLSQPPGKIGQQQYRLRPCLALVQYRAGILYAGRAAARATPVPFGFVDLWSYAHHGQPANVANAMHTTGLTPQRAESSSYTAARQLPSAASSNCSVQRHIEPDRSRCAMHARHHRTCEPYAIAPCTWHKRDNRRGLHDQRTRHFQYRQCES